MEELLKERPYYSDLFTMAVDPGPRTKPDMLVNDAAAGREAARLVGDAAQPWSPQTHELWPARGRARAEALVRLGWRLSSTDRSPGPFGNEAQSIMDAWRGLVMVHSLVRAEWEA